MADVFVTDGEELTTDIWEPGGAPPTNWFVAQGTGTTGAVKGDSALETESPETRVATTDTQPTASQNQHVATITATGTRAITEAGLLTLSSGGTLAVRSDFSAINVVSGDKIEFTFQITTA